MIRGSLRIFAERWGTPQMRAKIAGGTLRTFRSQRADTLRIVGTEQSRRADARGYLCRCCGFLTLSDPSYGSYEICPVCFWEDDPVQNEDPSNAGGANQISAEYEA
jgi:hypothetical protein